MERSARMTPPRATYRLQLAGGFGFAEAGSVAPYLAALGVSHVYLSSIFKARPGSTHGYDITDHHELNPDLGTEADFRAMIAAFQSRGLGRILDIVPNHMGIGGADNPLWLDVLEWGPESRYASWFDIDWRARGDELHGKLLTPALGEFYGEALRGGKLKLAFADGAFSVWAYGEHKLPVSPLTYPAILGRELPPLERLADEFVDLPQWRPQIAERAAALKAEFGRLARDDDKVRTAIDTRLALFNDDWAALDRLIVDQRWRIAFFRVAEDEINYRRFFNISELAGLRMELEPVFEHAHARILTLLHAGDINGLRIDHIDGLFDPKRYLTTLRERADEPFYLVVEKILAAHERLRADWPIDGSTGYDYLNESLGLLIDPGSEGAMTDLWRAFGGPAESFEETAKAAKLRILEVEMASELNALGRAAARLARSTPMTADLTRGALQRAIKQTIANFPVYRTYVDFSGTLDEADRRDIAWAISRARRSDPDLHPSAFDFLEAVLMADTRALKARDLSLTAALRVAMKLQQLSGPVMAKGVEDTAFYRYNRLIALNEVGGAPDRFGLAPAAFHRALARRARDWPNAMLASATHDTKRGEDARARLAVLSELPEEWAKQTTAWSRILRARRGDVEGHAPPAREDEYLLYQMIVGSWPMELLEEPSAAGLAAYRDRLVEALRKALREAKRRSSWSAPDLEYEEATLAFAAEAVRPDGNAFLDAFRPFVSRLARLGVDNGLAQTVLKLTAPGVPDTFQGCELWDLSFVDPDNRRPVDYAARSAALGSLDAPDGGFEGLMRTWMDGRVKLATIAKLLAFRREHPALFAEGDYAPIEIVGADADCAVGFLRNFGEEKLAVLVALRPAKRESRLEWEAFARVPEGQWRPLFGKNAPGPTTPPREAFATLPFAVAFSSEKPSGDH